MADKTKLQGSFGSLLDTLNNRFDPLQPEEIVGRWTGMMARCAACARDTHGWDGLPASSDRYDPLIHLLDEATRALVLADYDDSNSVSNALDQTSAALDQLEPALAGRK